MLAKLMMTGVCFFLVGFIMGRGRDGENSEEDAHVAPLDAGIDLRSAAVLDIAPETGGSEPRRRRVKRVTRASDALTELMIEGEQADFIPDAHVLAVIKALDDQPASMVGSLRLAVPSVTPTSRKNVTGWKGVRWRDDMRDMVEEITKDVDVKARALGRRAAASGHADKDGASATGGAAIETTGDAIETGARRPEGGGERANGARKRRKTRGGRKRRVDYEALRRRNSAIGLMALFERSETGYMASRDIDDELRWAGYEALPDRGALRGDIIRAAFPDVKRQGKRDGKWGLRLKSAPKI